MNLAGSIELAKMKKEFTKWKALKEPTPSIEEQKDPVAEKKEGSSLA